MTPRMTAAEFAAMVDDVVLAIRQHVTIDDEPGPVPQRPVVTATAVAGDGEVTLGWSISPASTADLVTGWVPRRGGKDRSGGGPWAPATPDPPQARSRRFDKLINGTAYEFGVRALLADGTTVEAQPVTATPVAAGGGPAVPGGVPVDRVVPLIGRSGLGHNSGVFIGGQDVAATSAFTRYVGGDIDAYLTFVTRNKGWDPMGAIHPSWPRLVAEGGIVIISIPPQPEGQRNDATARGDNNAWWRAYAAGLKKSGLTQRTVLRVGWECNGWWYDWSWGDDRGHPAKNSPESYVQAVRHVSDSAKTANPGLLVSCNLNRGSRRAGHNWRQVLDPLIETSPVTGQRYVDIVTLDSYDMHPGATSDGRWLEQIGQDPGPESVAAYCRSNGVQIGYEEWGPIKAGGAGGTGGGDNPRYAHGMWQLFQAQRDILAYEIAYPHVGTNDYDHRWLDGQKPLFSAAYLEHWRR